MALMFRNRIATADHDPGAAISQALQIVPDAAVGKDMSLRGRLHERQCGVLNEAGVRLAFAVAPLDSGTQPRVMTRRSAIVTGLSLRTRAVSAQARLAS